MNRRNLFWLLLPLTAFARIAVAAGVKVESAWARSTAPGSTVAAVYLRIDNRGGKADRLLTIKSPVATSAEVHRTVIEDDVARMRKVSVLHVDADQVVSFEPNGLHIMLFGLKRPLVKGKTITLELGFEVSGKQRVTVKVRDG